jgi:hypothetical protein
MSMFSILFPGEAARLARAERLLGRLADRAGYDEWSDPLLQDVVTEVREGKEIKAVQLYTQATGSGIGEARLAVEDLRRRLRSS